MPKYGFKGWQIYDYYQWLLYKIDGYAEPFYNYSLLLSELHSIEFKWKISNDENRAYDGEKLRMDYMEEENLPDFFYKEGVPCSVLEMLIALSVRCNGDILWDPKRNQTAEIFWMMIENLGLSGCTDDHFSGEFVRQQINNWLSRDFRRNGLGSPFPRGKGPHKDQRKITIWQQMCGYISERYFSSKI